MKEMKVLLVDDEDELVSTLAERMLLRGINTEWVTTAEDAIKKLDSSDYDIAVLDVKMPRTSGIELKKRMEEKRPEMKFIFITGHGSEADFQAGTAEAGLEYYLVKPVSIEILIGKMMEILGKDRGLE
jgi:DNA-binding response OmpR family regulator